MENYNENLTPEELIEKLKEKLEIDREEYSKIVENTNEEQASNEPAVELEEDEAEEIEYEDEIESEPQTEDELYSESEILSEAEPESEPEAVISDTEEAFFEEAEPEETPDVEFFAEDFTEDETEVSEITEEESADDIDPRILQMIQEIDEEEGEASSGESFDATVNFAPPASEEPEDDLSHTLMFGGLGGEATAVFDAAVDNQNATDIKKPKVYRFRRADDTSEQTKLHDAIAKSDISSDEDMEKTKLNDIPELNRPDLVVMQTFGATVEHVRNLYGDSVADEYEKMIANSDFTEREAAEYEYTSAAQKNEIFHDFKNKMKKSKLKIAVCAVLCAIMLLLENLSLFNIQLGGILDSTAYPVSYIMIDLQLLLLCGVFAFSVIKSGVAEIFMLEPTAKSASAAIFAVAVLVDIISCFVGGSVVLYNFTAGIALLFSMIFEVVTLKRDYMAFRILSSEKVKNAAIVGVGTSKNEEVSVYETLEEDEEVKIVDLQKGKFVKSFFARTKQVDSSTQDKIVLPLAAAAMIVMFVISLVIGKNASTALKVANMSFSAFLPFAVYFSLCYPTSKASRSVYENGAAIIGNAALEEYSGSSIISFEDRDVFPSYCVKLKSVKIYGNASIDRVLYNTASVFSKVGGPLCDVFSLSTVEIGSSDDIELVRAAEDGLEALVDGNRILVGLPSFMGEYGINVRVDENDSEDISRLYVAEGDELCAKFYIKYNLDVDFENVMTRMTSCGICAVLKTFDPNINDKMLASFVDTSKYPIKVIRGKIGDDFIEIHDELDSGIISTSGSKSTVDAIVTCERLYNIRSSANNVKIVSMIIGMILSAFIAIFGITPFSSLIVVLYQLLWMIPALVSGKLYL